MRPITTLLCVLAMTLGGTLAGCCDGGGGAPTPSMPPDQARATPGHGVGRSGGDVSAGSDSGERKPEDGPYVGELWLHPDPPMSDKDLRAEPTIDNPAGGFLDVDYQWYVDGDKLLGATSATISADELSRGTKLEVEVTATDVNGRQDSFRFGDIQVANGLPVITSRLGGSPNLDGYRFQGKDPDGDTLTWSIQGAPPGVAIGQTSGVMAIDTSKVYSSGTYDMEIVADDGHGGISRLSVSTALGGSQAAVQGVREVEDAEIVASDSMTDEQYLKAATDAAAKMDKMNAKEFDDYVDRSLQVEEQALEAAAGTEIPAGAPDAYPQ